MVENTSHSGHSFKKTMKNLKAKNLANKTIISLVLVILISVAIMPAVYSQEEQYGWETTLNFTETGGKKDSIVFGEKEDASDAKDAYDAPDPGGAPTPPYVDVSFTTSFKYPHSKLMYEFKHYSIQNIYKKWNFTINWQGDIPTDVTITWNPNEFNNCTYESIVLYNKTGVSLSDMKVENNYTFICSPGAIQSFEIICRNNQAPLLSSETPANNSENVDTNQEAVSIFISDPDGDIFNWTIEGKYVENAGKTNDTDGIKSATLHMDLPYDANIIWYVNATDGDSWTNATYAFDTKSKSGSGSNPGPPPSNQPPIADASAGKPYNGFVDEDITFNGSLSYDQDAGTITSWQWEFGDGTEGNGETIFHSYLDVGNYTVILTVTDDGGATGIDTTYAIITQKANNVPSKPILEGPTTGNKNTSYAYTAISTDADDNSVKYAFNWGDNTNATTEFLPNGTLVTQNHTWTAAGKYTIWVQAIDDKDAHSEKTYLTVLIDVMPISGKIQGDLVDEDSDGVYDFFYNYSSEKKTEVDQDSDGCYLIDSTGDDKWDFIYDSETEELTDYELGVQDPVSPQGQNTAIILLAIFLMIILIVSFIFIKRNNDNLEK